MYDMPATPETAAHRLRMVANDIDRITASLPNIDNDMDGKLTHAAKVCRSEAAKLVKSNEG